MYIVFQDVIKSCEHLSRSHYQLERQHLHCEKPSHNGAQHKADIVRHVKVGSLTHVHFVDYSKPCIEFALHHVPHIYIGPVWQTAVTC